MKKKSKERIFKEPQKEKMPQKEKKNTQIGFLKPQKEKLLPALSRLMKNK